MNTTPASHPWFVWTYYQTNAPGLHGWHSYTSNFQTECEARDYLAAPMKRGETRKELRRWLGDKHVYVTMRKRRPALAKAGVL